MHLHQSALEVLGPVERAVADKDDSYLAPLPPLIERLRSTATARLGASGAVEVDRALGFARAAGARSAEHPSIEQYLSHPLRIALITLSVAPEPTVETMQLGLLHNLYEVSRLDGRALVQAGYSGWLADAIARLTIDRAQESDLPYLEGFYARIEAGGPTVALVRTVDKLDNLLGLSILEEGAVRDRYVDLAERFVGPIARRLSSELGDYFAAVVQAARRGRFDAALRARYDRLATDASPR